MVYNATDRDKEKASARDTAIKLIQESKLKTTIFAGYFLPVARDFKKSYEKFGSVPHLVVHERKLSGILNKNYSETSNKFLNQIRSKLGEPLNAKEIDAQIKLAQALSQVTDISASSHFIAKTTSDSMGDSVHSVIIGAALSGVALSKAQIAKKARDKFIKDSIGRLETIGATQTQQAAESAKHTEAQVLDRHNAVFPKTDVSLAKTQIKKTWVSILDMRTRGAHASADMQTVDLDEPFTIGGQKLMHPGDMSLGATIDNTINCRCTAVSSITKD